jgi:hypothetical protein
MNRKNWHGYKNNLYLSAIFRYLSGILLIIVLLTGIDCKNNPVIPPDNLPDTTSHSVNWVIDGIGSFGSYLTDVAIVNDTLAFAVGQIHTPETDRVDSTGQWVFPYNVLKWNGNKWEPLRVKVKLTYEYSERITDKDPIVSVFANDSNEIWFGSQVGGITRLLDGQWKLITIPYGSGPDGANKIWCASSQEVYIISYGGKITRWKNNVWERIESGINIRLTDIYGSPDGSTIWIAGFDDFDGTVFFQSSGNGFKKILEITDPGIPHPAGQITHVFKSLWTDKSDTVYLGAIGRVYAAPKNTTIYAKENIWWDYQNEPGFPPETNIIRGTGSNDLFVGGFNFFVQHFNGKTWHRYPELEGAGSWYGMAVNKRMIFIVGDNNNNIRIARGYR